jgi:trehalose 2-sulfotransferase
MSAGFVLDYLGPEHDRPERSRASSAVRSYVVCSTPRSGSGLLCRGLASTGVLGAPLEYLNAVHRGILSERWGCGEDLGGYIAALHDRRSTPEGMFPIKVHWDQLVAVRAEATSSNVDRFSWDVADGVLSALFPNPVFVRIFRLDLDRQAVSLWRAQHSNVWSVAEENEAHAESHHAPYSFEGIEQCRRSIEIGEACWTRLLRRVGADPVIVSYEQLICSFFETVALVAGHIRPGVSVDVAPPRTRAMADDHSMQLLGRLVADREKRALASGDQIA